MGGSFGIALLNTFATNAIQVHAARLGERLGLLTPELARLSARSVGLVLRWTPGVALSDSARARPVAVQTIQQRAGVLGFDDEFVLAGVILLLGTPFAFMLERRARA